jgi:hypothetical protein
MGAHQDQSFDTVSVEEFSLTESLISFKFDYPKRRSFGCGVAPTSNPILSGVWHLDAALSYGTSGEKVARGKI